MRAVTSKKLLIPVTLFMTIITLLFGFAFFTPMETLIIKSCAKESNSVERALSQWALFSFHGRKGEISKLQEGRGLNFIVSYPAQQSIKVFRWLESKGADINTIASSDGLTPLHSAIVQDNTQLVAYLIKQGADTSIEEKKRGMTAQELLEMLEPEKEKSVYFSMMESLCYKE